MAKIFVSSRISTQIRVPLLRSFGYTRRIIQRLHERIVTRVHFRHEFPTRHIHAHLNLQYDIILILFTTGK